MAIEEPFGLRVRRASCMVLLIELSAVERRRRRFVSNPVTLPALGWLIAPKEDTCHFVRLEIVKRLQLGRDCRTLRTV